MKQLIILLLCLVPLTVATAQGGTDVREITAVLDKQAMEWNAGNIEGYMQGYWNNDSLLFIGSKGPVYGYRPTLERYKKSYPDKHAMGILSFSALSFKRLSDEYYFVTGRWSLQRKDDNPNGYFTLLFRKIKKQWLIVADHSS
ncbi:MAG TPA: nuclear transport factor 2 family protein [Flavipsychrobacter sp.]|nr:nuclear transport factor 2 family protein [Flavipsychrobacter sp.]